MFKYFPPERIDILQKNLICFNNPRHFNDPFEFFSLYNLDGFMNNLSEKIKNLDIISNLPPEHLALFEHFSSEHKNLILESTKELLNFKLNENIDNILNLTRKKLSDVNDEFIKLTRVLCLTEKPDNILMWAHYAASHTGFVVEFDQTNEFFHQRRNLKDKYGYLRAVKYEKEIPEIDPVSENITQHFLIKSEDWKYEQEWRMFALENDAVNTITKNNNTYELYTLPPDSIKRVILGCQTSATFELSMTNVLKNEPKLSHIILTKARRSNSKFEIEID